MRNINIDNDTERVEIYWPRPIIWSDMSHAAINGSNIWNNFRIVLSCCSICLLSLSVLSFCFPFFS